MDAGTWRSWDLSDGGRGRRQPALLLVELYQSPPRRSRSFKKGVSLIVPSATNLPSHCPRPPNFLSPRLFNLRWGVFAQYQGQITPGMTTEEIYKFELQQFYDILMSVNIKQKLKPFVRQFKKRNIPFIYETVVNIIQVITGKQEIPLMKFNALMATKLFFDTGEYLPITLVEIYLLPIIFQLASYRIQKRSEEGLTLYFIEKGYDSTKEMKRIGFNYVLLAIEFIFMSAQVKPYRNLENNELKEESNYAKVSKLLQEKGVQPIQNYKFYIPSYINQARKRYMKKLSRFNADEYVEFFLKLISDQMNMNKKPDLQMKKLFLYGDAFITIPLMHICEDQLSNMQTNFVNKKKYLNLIGDFMKQGDIYAVLIITRSSFLQTIFEKIQKVKGENGLQVGETIYPQVEAAKADKKEFYIEFLKHIELWANCHPVDEDGEPTDAKKIFDILKTQRKFVFPPNILMTKIKAEMQANLKQNQKRNEKLIKLVDENSASYDTRRKHGSSFGGSKISKRSSKLKPNSYIEFDEIEEIVLQAKRKLTLLLNQEKLAENISALQKFKIFWQTNAEKNEIDADQSCDVQIVLQQGHLCVKIIEMVLPVYNLYKTGKLSFEDYKDKVDLLMKKEADDKPETSLEQELPVVDESESVENFEDTYEKESLSNLHSNIKESEIKPLSSRRKEESNVKVDSEIEEFPSQKTSNLSNEHDMSRMIRNKEADYGEIRESENEKFESKESSKVQPQSNMSFKQSYNSSFQRDNKEKEKEKSHYKNQEESQLSSAKNDSDVKSNRFVLMGKNDRSFKESFRRDDAMNDSRSSNGSRRSQSSKRILQRRGQPSKNSNIKSNISKQSESHIDPESSLQYKDALFVKQPPNEYQINDYEPSNESFISSNKSSMIKPQIQPSPKKFSVLKAGNIMSPKNRDHQSIRIDQQSQMYEQNLGPKVVSRKYVDKNGEYDDYYGINEGQVFKTKNSQVSNQSNRSSKLRNGSRSGSAKKQSSIRRSFVKNNEMNDYDDVFKRKYRENQDYSSSLLSQNDGSERGRLQRTQVRKSSIKQSRQRKDEILKSNSSSFIANNLPLSILSRFDEDDSKILEPEHNPLLHSFHQYNDNELTTNPSKIGSFKDCFEVNNEIILSKESNQKLMRFSKSGKIVNFIETAYPRQTPKSSSIVDILSERNAKNSIENYRNQRQKCRQTQTLSQKVKSLQSFNKNMRMKLVIKKQEVTSQQNNEVKFSMTNGSEQVSFYNESSVSRQKSETNLKLIELEFPVSSSAINRSRLINKNIYNHYFPQQKSDKTKKCMLKSKSLIYKSDQFQIGYVGNKKEKYLDISFFITPLKDTIEDVSFSLYNDQNMTIKLNNEYLEQIKVNQQEHINMICTLENVPYVIPTLSFKFKANKHYQNNHMLVPVPCSYNKYITYHPITEDSLNQMTSGINQDLISTEQFKYNPKLMNVEKIKQALPNFAFAKKEGRIQYYGSEVYYKGKIFLLKFGISEKGTMQLQGKNMTGDHKNTKFLQFLLITYRQIFEISKKAK